MFRSLKCCRLSQDTASVDRMLIAERSNEVMKCLEEMYIRYNQDLQIICNTSLAGRARRDKIVHHANLMRLVPKLKHILCTHSHARKVVHTM